MKKEKPKQLIQSDIAGRKRAEKALIESEEKFHNYIERAPDGVFIVDEAGLYREVNKSACRITGYSKEEIEQRISISDLLAKESLEEGLAHFKKVMATGNATSDLWHKHKDGSKRCLTVNAVKLSKTRVLGFCKDITERMLAENDLKEKNIALAEVLEQIELGKEKLRHEVTANINENVLPLVEKLKLKIKLKQVIPVKNIDLLEARLKKITSLVDSKVKVFQDKLSRREHEICDLIADGLSNKEISSMLEVALHTVEKHRHNIREKLKLSHKNVNLASFLQKR
jgi:PAS domain S-box-containing protein